MQSFAVIPAAGRSVRMGCPKLLLPWRGATVIECVLAAWRAAAVSHIIAVVRRDDPALATFCSAGGAELVRPEIDPPDMKTSVRLALEFAARQYHPAPTDVWLLAPADQPRLSAAVVRRLLDLHDHSQPSILVPTCGGRRGHPVLFPWTCAAEVHRLGENEGVNRLLTRHPVRLIEVDEAAILDDLDTPHDYQQLQDS